MLKDQPIVNGFSDPKGFWRNELLSLAHFVWRCYGHQTPNQDDTSLYVHYQPAEVLVFRVVNAMSLCVSERKGPELVTIFRRTVLTSVRWKCMALPVAASMGGRIPSSKRVSDQERWRRKEKCLLQKSWVSRLNQEFAHAFKFRRNPRSLAVASAQCDQRITLLANMMGSTSCIPYCNVFKLYLRTHNVRHLVFVHSLRTGRMEVVDV